MSVDLTLIIAIGVLVACGTTLVLERSLTRILVGFVLLGNGVNLFFIVASGPPGAAPIVRDNGERMADPLPQAMALTAIVITLGVTAFGLALAYRTWQLEGHDDVQDDVEDALVIRRAERDDLSASFDEVDESLPEEEGADLPAVDDEVTDENAETADDEPHNDGAPDAGGTR
ncbi:Na(+)/H(+) antiporter subunit C [Aeromicrobium sp. Leaf350]|uniref:Na(+)/H(+) antiporter subunit C n=1 Tax=Aeromicrobium sp. Leaf350 TaxID=2876565 RepID=UPI001E2B6820|nr:Na(+)/H(+) antiporter subunit C [Aeromicrobium sp. Leaf350]